MKYQKLYNGDFEERKRKSTIKLTLITLGTLLGVIAILTF